MNEIEKIKESLARHQHSTATMRLANPPFVEGVSKEQVEWLITENDDKHVETMTAQLADTTRALEETRRMLVAAQTNAESSLHTIQQFSAKMEQDNAAHAAETDLHKEIIATHIATKSALQVRIRELESRSWWRHTLDCIKGWFGK